MSDTSGLHLAHRCALRDLVEAYARHADRRELTALAALFVADGELSIHVGDADAEPSVVRRSRHEIESAVGGLHRYDVTTHLLGQHLIELDLSGPGDPERATGEAYCLAHHIHEVDGRRVNHVLSIRYLDRYVRTESVWRFASRRLVIDWAEDRLMDLPEDLPPAPPA